MGDTLKDPAIALVGEESICKLPINRPAIANDNRFLVVNITVSY